MREAKTLVGMQSLTSESYTVRSTINAKLQRATEAALQDGLARYEAQERPGASTRAPNSISARCVARINTEQSTRAQRRGRVVKPIWQIALQSAQLPLYDVHWPVGRGSGPRARRTAGPQVRVGLLDGRIVPLSLPDGVDARHAQAQRRDLSSTSSRARPSATPRPSCASSRKVQGAALVLENKTGRILAMVGGFSYPLSQLNRTTQALRQPGSSIKPLIYLAALHRGLQPNTLVHRPAGHAAADSGRQHPLLDAEEL